MGAEMPEPTLDGGTVVMTTEQFAAIMERLDRADPPLPPVEPRWDDPEWGPRTCQVCGQPAEVIDCDEALRRSSPGLLNGEGYCQAHVPDEVMSDGHLRLEK